MLRLRRNTSLNYCNDKYCPVGVKFARTLMITQLRCVLVMQDATRMSQCLL